MAEERIRCFIAIELPDGIRRKISQLQEKLKAGSPDSVRWINPDSIHLTLNFLGDVASERVAEITGAMREAARGVLPFSLEVRGTGIFPSVKRARVAWVGLGGEVDTLLRLQKELASNLEVLGFMPEAREFTPHLTLARVNERASPEERQRFGELVTSAKFESGSISVSAISLMRSQLNRAGAIYSRLSLVELGAKV